MKVLDKENQFKWDSICEIHNWIGRNNVIDTLLNPFLILFHSSTEMRVRYIKRGYDLAMENKVDWEEVLNLFEYSLNRDAMLSKNHEVNVPFVNINDKNENLLQFFTHALAKNLKENIPR